MVRLAIVMRVLCVVGAGVYTLQFMLLIKVVDSMKEIDDYFGSHYLRGSRIIKNGMRAKGKTCPPSRPDRNVDKITP